MVTIGTELFTWMGKERKEFVADLSTIEGNTNATFNDELRYGFKLRSERTGRKIVVRPVRAEYSNDVDHEVIAWHFAPITPRPMFSVVLLND